MYERAGCHAAEIVGVHTLKHVAAVVHLFDFLVTAVDDSIETDTAEDFNFIAARVFVFLNRNMKMVQVGTGSSVWKERRCVKRVWNSSQKSVFLRTRTKRDVVIVKW